MQERIDAFFEFIYDRQEIWHKRSYLKQPAPWTSDPILNTYKFCNVYRELDAGTQAVCRYLQKPEIAPQVKLFNLTAYRFFNRRDTIEKLFGGLMNPYDFDFSALEQRFDECKRRENIFSNAYLIASHPFDPAYRPHDKHIQILLMLNSLAARIDDYYRALHISTAAGGLAVIRRFVKFAGPFLSGQILLDATYAGDIVNYTADDLLVVGPGAHWGLNIILGKKLNKAEADAACRRLYSMQEQGFSDLKRRTGKDWINIRWNNPAYPNTPYLCLHDIQNSLCEFRKYWRLKAQEKAKKRYFKAQS